MFCASTRPVPEEATDFGLIGPDSTARRASRERSLGFGRSAPTAGAQHAATAATVRIREGTRALTARDYAGRVGRRILPAPRCADTVGTWKRATRAPSRR